jgi:hypothetical protein
VHPRKQYPILTVKARKPIRSARIAKAEQVSKTGWHLDVKLEASADIDSELLGRLREAHDSCI